MVAALMIGRIGDAVEMHQLGPAGEHRQRLDLAAMSEAVALRAKHLLGHVAGLHGEHRHPDAAVQILGGDGERGDVALMPVDDHQPFGAMARPPTRRSR